MGRPRKNPETETVVATEVDDPDERYEGPRPQNDEDYRDAGQLYVDELEQGHGAA
jgi:hypothetical protein